MCVVLVMLHGQFFQLVASHNIIHIHNNVYETDIIMQNIPSFKLKMRNTLHNAISPT